MILRYQLGVEYEIDYDTVIRLFCVIIKNGVKYLSNEKEK